MSELARQLEASIEQVKSAKLARAPEPEDGLAVERLIARVQKIRTIQGKLMTEGQHYGKVPGIDKPTLLKPGAELLCLAFQLDAQFASTDAYTGDHLESIVTCTLHHSPTSTRVGSGIGSCSTREKKYAWRGGERLCPSCSAPAIRPSKYNDCKWYCNARAGGCGAKFKPGDQAIEGQQTGRVQNPDLADQYNTVRKMACKRALVAAVLVTCGASELFTQDVEDHHEPESRPRIAPHVSPDEPGGDAGDGGESFNVLFAELEEIEKMVAACETYDSALHLRGELGSRSKQSPLTKSIQRCKEDRLLSSRDSAELSKTWMRVNRQLEKLERNLAPGPADSFVDEP